MADQQIDRLSRKDFSRLAEFIEDYSGIKMPPAKQTMVEGRLRKRVTATGCSDLTEYCRHVFDKGGMETEAIHLIDVVTTNKTEFFRESDHFRFLADTALPRLVADMRKTGKSSVKIWSAASSIGAEAYTIAIVASEASISLGGFATAILGTDISSRVLQTAAAGIFPADMIEPVPMPLRKRYLLRSKDPKAGLVRLIPELRQMVTFRRLNLMDETYPVDRDMDVIFCRNMLIYFDKPTQQMVLKRLCAHLRKGGYLFLGHSESLAGSRLPLIPSGPTVFRHE